MGVLTATVRFPGGDSHPKLETGSQAPRTNTGTAGDTRSSPISTDRVSARPARAGKLEGDPADASAHASAPIGHLSMTLASMRLIPNHDCSAVLRDPSKRGGRHVLSGPAGLTWLEVAEALTETLGRPITYDEVSVEERRAQLEASGLDEWRVDLLLGLDEINRAELYRTPTDTVEVLTGHRPRTIHDYIARHRAAFAQ